MWKRNDVVMKTVYYLVSFYMFKYMYICRVIYLLGTCIYVGYICIFIFTLNSCVILPFYFYKGLILWIFILIVAAPVCKVTLLFVHFWTISYGPLKVVSYLYGVLVLVMTLSPPSIILIDSNSVFAHDFLFSPVYACQAFL